MKINAVEAVLVNACEYTNWTFVQVHTDAGLVGLGEATIPGSEGPLQAAIAELNAELRGADAARIRTHARLRQGAAGGRAHYAALSAVEHALWDLAGQELGVPVHRLLGGAARERVPLYANLNRGTRDRSPAGFAAVASRAVTAGFRAVKCTPFDGVQPGAMAAREGRAQVQTGLERVFRVREAVGPDVQVMVDCHWRFTAAEAIQVARELESCRLFWLEDMVSDAEPAPWLRFRQARPDRVAGGERKVGLGEFLPFVTAGAWDIVCPDVKYCGGLAETQRIAALAEACGLPVAPHNPSGPVSTLASAHVCATLPNLAFLEYAFGECDWRGDLVQGAERIEDGCLVLPRAPGLGCALDPQLVGAHPYTDVVPLSVRIGLPTV